MFPNHMPKELMMANHSPKGELIMVPCLCSQSLIHSTLAYCNVFYFKKFDIPIEKNKYILSNNVNSSQCEQGCGQASEGVGTVTSHLYAHYHIFNMVKT